MIEQKNIKLFRKIKHMTQEELAKRIGVNQSLISRVETGSTKKVADFILEKISTALDYSPDDLIDERKGGQKMDIIELYLDKLNIPRKQKGYLYIKDILFFTINDKNTDLNKPKNLAYYYRYLADKYKSKSNSIKHLVNSAILWGFIETKNIALWDELFGGNIEPTTKEFFKTLTNQIILEAER